MTHPVPLFPETDWMRKMLPVYKQLTRYFPRAFREMTKVSVVNNVRYNPEREANDINWARGKSIHQMDSALKHMMEHADGKVFDLVDPAVAKVTGIDRIYILAQAMWRIGAELELLVEKTELAEANVPQPSPYADTNDVVQQHCKCGERLFNFRAGDMTPTVIANGIAHNMNRCDYV